MSDEVSDTFALTLAGRQVMFRRAKLGQILMLQRSAQRMITRAESDENDQGKSMTEAVIKTLDFVETLIVTEDDRQFVEDQMLAGTIDYIDVLAALGGKGDLTPDDEEPKAVKRTSAKSKATPVDLSKKKPAQIVAKPVKTANRARTKR